MKNRTKKTIGYKQTIELLKQGHIIIDYAEYPFNGSYLIRTDDFEYSVRCDSFHKLLYDNIICRSHNLSYYTGYSSDKFISTYTIKQ